MGLFRSEDMDLYRIYIDKDEAQNIMMELGKLGYVHFINLNFNVDSFKLKFSTQVKQIEDSFRQLSEIENTYARYHIPMAPVKSNEEFIDLVNNWSKYNQNGQPLLIDEIRDEIKKSHTHIKEQESLLNDARLSFKRQVLTQEILKTFESFTKNAQAQFVQDSASQVDTPQNLSDPLLTAQIKYLGGIIKNEHMISFRRSMFRQLRGKVFVHTFSINLDVADTLVDDDFGNNKNVFILAYQGGNITDEKIRRICNAYSEDEVLDIKQNYYQQELQTVQNKKLQLKDFIKSTAVQMKAILKQQDKNQQHDVSVFKLYKLFIMRQKEVYIHLNYLNQQGQTYQALTWIPRIENFVGDVQDITKSQRGLHVEKGSDDIALKRPTYFVLNDFTRVPQQIIDTYGIPTYKEVNPAIFACVTFPFFFGVMFGDVMHGSLLLVFSIYLCMRPKPAGQDPLHEARYFLLLSGAFALFCGLIYNDFSSMNTMIFGESCYEHFGREPVGDDDFVFAEQKKNCVYPFGFDPIWYRSEQEIVFLNSFKMKTSVIFGVMQMSLGTVMKGFNAVYFKRNIELIFDVFTQIALLMALFGFMDIMIFLKWTTDWEEVAGQYNDDFALAPGARQIKAPYQMDHAYQKNGSDAAPSIIQTMIVMFIKMGTPVGTLDGQNPQAPLMGNLTDGYSTQAGIMGFCLVVALISIPLMLLVNPCVNSKKASDVDEGQPSDIVMAGDLGEQSSAPMKIEDLCGDMLVIEHDHTFGEMFIHQMIETIEYALGTVSNTASYLRLWALSLAHGQLAKVFFNFTVGILLKDGGAVGLWLAFYVFFAITFGVLMVMDLLEAMLHTLRLHWVEFQNKFFKGEGFAFAPMDFNRVFEEQE